MSRIFQVALAIERSRINAHPGFDEQTALFRQHQKGTNRKPLLLIDEIENGLHYSVHAKLWEFILRVAADQDIQVVATTHSWDCICGLKEAVARTPNADAMLIRLERTADKDKAVSFSQDELDIITRDEIEVR